MFSPVFNTLEGDVIVLRALLGTEVLGAVGAVLCLAREELRVSSRAQRLAVWSATHHEDVRGTWIDRRSSQWLLRQIDSI